MAVPFVHCTSPLTGHENPLCSVDASFAKRSGLRETLWALTHRRAQASSRQRPAEASLHHSRGNAALQRFIGISVVAAVVAPLRRSASTSSGSSPRRRRCQLQELKSTGSGVWQNSFLITTRDAEVRRAEAEKALRALREACLGRPVSQEEDCVELRIFDRDVEDGARGCYTSHMAIYKEALAAKLPWALVFEDNLEVNRPETGKMPAPVVQKVLSWASEASASWDVLHLALVHSAASLQLCEGPHRSITKVQRTAPDWYGPVSVDSAPGLGTTAYLISRKGMEAMLKIDSEQGYNGTPIDDVLAERFPDTTFAAFPAPLRRGRSQSLINPQQELFRAVMFQPPVATWVEQALVTTRLSSSNLVWVFLLVMFLWTVFITLPLARALQDLMA